MVADGTAYLYAHDANKNVSELVDARTGETAAHYDYSVDDATGLSYNGLPILGTEELRLGMISRIPLK